jgi:hypothetical protein
MNVDVSRRSNTTRAAPAARLTSRLIVLSGLLDEKG